MEEEKLYVQNIFVLKVSNNRKQYATQIKKK